MVKEIEDQGIVSLLNHIFGRGSVEAAESLSPERMEQLKKQAVAVLATLTPREEKVLRMRFGIGEEPKTIEEVGEDFYVTRERIRQIEAKALRKMRNPIRRRTILSGDSIPTPETSKE